MPDLANPMTNIGYLIAACAATIIGLVGYVFMLAQWTREARARNARLKAETEPAEPTAPAVAPRESVAPRSH